MLIFKINYRNKMYISAIVSSLLLFSFSPYFTYSILFRGYIFQSLLCFSGAYFSYKYLIYQNSKFMVISNLLFTISFIHLPTTVYIWIPAILTILTLKNSKKEIKAIFKSFIYPSIILIITFSFIILFTGYVAMKPVSPSTNHFIFTLINNTVDLIKSGIETVFFHKHYNSVSSSYADYIKIFLNVMFAGPHYLGLIIIGILSTTFFLYKANSIKRTNFIFIIISSFYLILVHLLVGKVSYVRVHLIYLPFIALIIGILVDRSISLLLKNYENISLIIYISIFCLFFTTITIKGKSYLNDDKFQFPTRLDLPTHNHIKNIVRNNCEGSNNLDSDSFRQQIAFYYMQECSQKWSLVKIRNFIRKREINKDAKYLIINKWPGRGGPSEFSNLDESLDKISNLTDKVLIKNYEDDKILGFTIIE